MTTDPQPTQRVSDTVVPVVGLPLRKLVRRIRGEANPRNGTSCCHRRHPHTRAALLWAARDVERSADTLAQQLTQIVLALSIHPAGCKNWKFYEQLCLDCADQLDEIVKGIERPRKKLSPNYGSALQPNKPGERICEPSAGSKYAPADGSTRKEQ